MKNARDYLEYLKENPEERELTRTLAPADLQAHVRELGFEFTPEELQDEMELGVELAADALDAAGGASGDAGDGTCDGHCGQTCEDDWLQCRDYQDDRSCKLFG